MVLKLILRRSLAKPCVWLQENVYLYKHLDISSSLVSLMMDLDGAVVTSTELFK